MIGIQPSPESSLSLTSQGAGVFSPVNRAAAYTQFGSHPIEIPNTNQDAEPFLQGSLHHMAWGGRHLTTRDLQELSHWGTEFGRMPMPSVLQGGISSQTDIAQQLVGRGSTDLHPCHRRRFVKGDGPLA